VPYGLPIGFYFVGAIFTCSNDRDRSNNALSTSGHAILVPWPTDISVQSVDADGDVYLPGESIIVRIEIEGIGGHLDTSFEIDVYASTDLMITTSDYKIHSYEGETISPEESRLLSEACQLPSDIPAGDYYIGIIITYLVEDGTDSTTYNDHNTVYIGGYLDLVVQSVGITPGAYQPGQEFVVYNLIKNVGGGNAKSYTVDYYA
jgi:hypothetical protein